MKVTVKLTQYHLPEQCTVHPNKIFQALPREHDFPSLKVAMETIADWNTQCPCWQYAVTGVGPTS